MKVKRLEQTGAIQLIFYLAERGEAKMGEIIQNHKSRVSQSALYRSIPLLKELKLIDRRNGVSSPPLDASYQ